MENMEDKWQRQNDAAVLRAAAEVQQDPARLAGAKSELENQKAAINQALGSNQGTPSTHPAHQNIGLAWVKGGESNGQ